MNVNPVSDMYISYRVVCFAPVVLSQWHSDKVKPTACPVLVTLFSLWETSEVKFSSCLA